MPELPDLKNGLPDEAGGPAEQAFAWRFRGYDLRSGEFNTAMVHFYRAEINRANVWRSRLDNTTNWAVISTGAALSFTFSSVDNNHIMIPINTLLVALFLFIEARRNRYYELWSYRIRLIETEFYAAMLTPPFAPSADWAPRMAESLRHPCFTISFAESFGRRFRRNYQYLFLILAMSWLIKISIHPGPLASVDEFFKRASLSFIPGPVIFGAGLVLNLALFAVGWWSVRLNEASGEVFDR